MRNVGDRYVERRALKRFAAYDILPLAASRAESTAPMFRFQHAA
jgi:hypothetical protein